ncbi:Daunorubicin/doxorubicin resistance ATP-binding protein DrrA [Nocardioides dokdonensis FR1436]|uniref:Daunorubicin/doxorubicin resistance ATP-binding protein DrrA n=1 Tax=Nocardioides dokdonensis FR1436 TaxID=1300347 RepID=A0A1A9GIV6_9ACTN|nr:ABC transporter ATP-binding protein [Nocardioides dokdonensis]ANH37441.1 Daunorubicin/doxorubicin resistance ATP-binding protein DrrA [Nocardioides dokdonensis FR1436]
MSTRAVQMTGLTKTFAAPAGTHGPPVTAVDAVDLTIRPGEVVAFLGPNGAGKTTTVDMLLGLTRPTSGSVEVYGTSPRRAVAAGRVSAVLQTGGLLPDFTVRETVRAIAALHGRPDRVDHVIERARLTGLAGRLVQACSGGEQQRLKFALALVADPDLVVLDEPTTGMDVGARRDFWDTMRADAADGRTIVFATHYLAEADEFADRTVLMARGRIVADGPTADVRAAYGGRTLTFRPPAEVVHPHGVDPAWLEQVRTSLAPLGITDLDVSSASLEAAFLALTGTPQLQDTAQEALR